MSNTLQLVIAGFGGQGVLFAGKILVYAGMLEGKEVSWLPSYGPEMRGGTANINVIVSDKPVGSPIILTPDVLVAMNQPSLVKFENDVVTGGAIIVDSSLVSSKITRTDVDATYIPATNLATESDLSGLANMIIVGKIAKVTGFFSMDSLEAAVRKSVPERKKDLVEFNIKAIKMGFDYE